MKCELTQTMQEWTNNKLNTCPHCGDAVEWRDVLGYEGTYEVSNIGTVRSTKSGREMAIGDNGRGYKIVGLSLGGKRKNHYVHRLVCTAFCKNEEAKPCVNHKDHNRSNNCARNLEWVTTKENVNYSVWIMRHPRNYTHKNRSVYGTGIRHKQGRFEVAVCDKYVGRRTTLDEAIALRDEYTKMHYNFIYDTVPIV